MDATSQDDSRSIHDITPLTWLVISALGLGFWLVVGLIVARYA